MIESIEDLSARLSDSIKASSNVFIVGHNSPDFDSIGSSIGLLTLAESLGKKAYIIVDDRESMIEPGVKRIIDENRSRFRIIKKENFLKKFDSNSLLILTDVNKKNLISVGDYVNRVGRVIVIDHHAQDENTVSSNDKYITSSISSASEAVTRVLNHIGIEFDSVVANALLAGISLDTKRFKHNTSAITHNVAEKLIDRGANTDYVNSLFFAEFESYCRISNLIINGTIIRKYSESLLSPIQVSFTLNRNQPNTTYIREDLAKAADKMLSFIGIDAAFTIGFVEDGIVHISARGNKRVDVGKIMEQMHGGGNSQSAAGRITADDLFAIEEELMSKVANGISSEEKVVEEPQVIKVKQIDQNV